MNKKRIFQIVLSENSLRIKRFADKKIADNRVLTVYNKYIKQSPLESPYYTE